jgi:hypothetical protein
MVIEMYSATMERTEGILGNLPSREAFWEYCRQQLKDLIFTTYKAHQVRFPGSKCIPE